MENRFQKDVDHILTDPIEGVNIYITDAADQDKKDGYKKSIYISIEGPKNTPYVGGIYRFKMDVADNYPFKQPRIIDLQHTYHIRAESEKYIGCCCCNFYYLRPYNKNWVPKNSLREVIRLLKQSFYPESFYSTAIVSEEFQLYHYDKESFIQKVQNLIIEEKMKLLPKQILYFNKLIAPELNLNSMEVFVDLIF